MSVSPIEKKLKNVTLVTDGACLGNPGPGGWAALLRYNGHEKLISGGELLTTNNRMELMAVIRGLDLLKERCHVHIQTDSKYVMDAFDKGWINGWQRNGWQTAAKKPVKNQELWEELADAVARHRIRWEWVKGHSGHADNERVDQEAQAAAQVAAKAGR
jgi:ribonuclease HI